MMKGTDPSAAFNTTGVAKYSDFGPIEGSRKRCKIRGKLVFTNGKLYMSFRLVPKSMILNDLEQRNGRYFASFQRIRVASRPRAHCVKVVEDIRYLNFPREKCSPKHLVFGDISHTII